MSQGIFTLESFKYIWISPYWQCHMPAQNVTKHSLKGAIWEHMHCSSLMKSHISAENVTMHSHQVAVSEHINCSTLVKSHIKEFSLRVHLKKAWINPHCTQAKRFINQRLLDVNFLYCNFTWHYPTLPHPVPVANCAYRATTMKKFQFPLLSSSTWVPIVVS